MELRSTPAWRSSPERWAPALGLAVLAAAYALLARGLKAWPLAGLAVVLGVAGYLLPLRVPQGPARRRLARWVPAVIPAVVAYTIDLQPYWIEALLPDPDRRYRFSLLALSVAVTLVALIFVGLDPGRAVERAVHAVTGAFRYLVSVAVYAVVLLPLGIARIWRRADPLATGGTTPASAWYPSPTTSDRLTTRTFRVEEASADPRVWRAGLAAVPRAVGLVVLLLAADFGIGATWDEVAGDGPAQRLETAQGAISIELGAESAVLDGPDAEVFPDDPREDLPAMADYPWRHDYFQELQRAPSTFWPYVMWRPLPATGTYLNILDTWERLTYRSPDSDGPDVPDVDFYGGSTTYGEGQRDLHTIPSEVVRLAEADGLPIRAHNRGVRGWVNWQEMLLFEQLSADPATRPDLALFYDGANELDAQSHSIQGVPAHTVLDEIAQRLAGDQAVATDRTDAPEPADPTMWGHLQLLGRDYRDTSAVMRVGGWLRRTVTGEPAAAAGSQDPDYDAVPGIYQRGQALIEDIARRQDVTVLFFWQPLQGGGWDTYQDDLRPPTIDLSRLFIGHDDIFIDGTHHNEAGSLIAAEAIWEHLRPQVEAWYEDR